MLNDYDNNTSTNMTLSDCTNNEKIIDIMIPSLLLTIPCGLSFLYLISFMAYTLIKPLFKKIKITSNYKISFLLDRVKEYVSTHTFVRIFLYKYK